MSKVKVLYVANEMNPFLETSDVANFLRMLPQYMQEKGLEVRILVPRFGIINERKNRLHEVVRLSGINIAVGDDEKPLVIKVASVPNAKLQVYFIDNDDYFHRKSVFADDKNNLHPDNDERAIFFCKGVLETVKKLGWSPDIIHCTDWMTGLIPMYLKTTYAKDPVFKDTKCVFSVYNNPFKYTFEGNLATKAKMFDLDASVFDTLENANCESFIQMGMQYADAVIKGDEDLSPTLNELFAGVESKIKRHINMEDENVSETHFDLYNELIG
ncbi:MAG: hypothetical protein RLZZ175_2025 [Bacteroidota bacterium]|jgi:starch synthase